SFCVSPQASVNLPVDRYDYCDQRGQPGTETQPLLGAHPYAVRYSWNKEFRPRLYRSIIIKNQETVSTLYRPICINDLGVFSQRPLRKAVGLVNVLFKAFIRRINRGRGGQLLA